ncbi:MAG: phosphoglycerate kinase [Saprospiraceae bacterium]|nr:phosphoglycerate kinase [Saprospiraceae bacterium]
MIKASKTILWNGPMGVFEFEKFATGFLSSKGIGRGNGCRGIFTYRWVETASAIKSGLEDKASFVSTGGGAMLEFLEGKELPGIEGDHRIRKKWDTLKACSNLQAFFSEWPGTDLN